jgi:hypothetical protein
VNQFEAFRVLNSEKRGVKTTGKITCFGKKIYLSVTKLMLYTEIMPCFMA